MDTLPWIKASQKFTVKVLVHHLGCEELPYCCYKRRESSEKTCQDTIMTVLHQSICLSRTAGQGQFRCRECEMLILNVSNSLVNSTLVD
jgi:hypothetical protein